MSGADSTGAHREGIDFENSKFFAIDLNIPSKSLVSFVDHLV